MDYVSYLVNAVMKSSAWQSTAIVVTWDDYGGFYDHVPPPQVGNDGEGFRVPTLVISPYAKHGYVDHTPYEFSSLLSLVEGNFGLPSLGQRDSAGIGKDDMMNSFDFNQKPQPALMEAGNFVGPGNSPPQSNGYPAYGGQTTSSSTSSSTLSSSSSSTVPEFGANAAFYSLLGLVTFAAIATSFVYKIRREG
jgi:phospholipase C